jgi:hypothetical protein
MGMIEKHTPIRNPSFHTQTHFVHLSNEILSRDLKSAVQREKTATLEVLEYLLEVERRKYYATCAYSSLFEYVVQELGYSESQASERINSMRLLREVPEVKAKLENGELSITTASQIQRFIKNEKRFAGDDLSLEEKGRLIDLCSNQSKRDVERTLFAMQSEEAKIESAERTRWVSEEHAELKFLVPDGVLHKISEVRNLVGEATLSQIFSESLDRYLVELKKKYHREEQAKSVKVKPVEVRAGAGSGADHDAKSWVESKSVGHSSKEQKPTEKVARPATWNSSAQVPVRSRYVPAVFRRMVFARSNGQCEFIDPKTRNRCLSRYRLQIDHVFPYALGGKTTLDNLRHLCANHNQRSAIEYFS